MQQVSEYDETSSFQAPYRSELSLANMKVIGTLQRNKFAEEAESLMAKFAQKWDTALPNFEQYCTMNGFLFPDTSIERLVAIGNFNNLLFYIDDIAAAENAGSASGYAEELKVNGSCVSIETIERWISIFETGQLPPHVTPLERAFADVRKQFLDISGDNTEWYQRFLVSGAHYFRKTSRAHAHLPGDTALNLDKYIAWREHDSGMYPVIDLIEFACDLRIPEEVINSPVVSRLRLNCARIGGLMNDVFSYQKETIIEGNRFNLVNLILEKDKCGLKTAAEAAMEVVNSCTFDFIKHENQISGWDAAICAAVRKYVEGMKNQINATWYWQMFTNRYRSPDSPFVELRQRLN
ncbi:MAG TPA: hypothetical protein VH186_28480 [Chloroflexia bacterium]|nr:hypothetical protein [Chloroflexia bacterium]